MPDKPTLAVPNATAQTRIRATVEAVEAHMEAKREADAGIAGAYREAKDAGLDVAGLKRMIARRAKDATQRAHEVQIDDLYEAALVEGGDA
jgi:uncharacterized protein (UPF0335 family)